MEKLASAYPPNRRRCHGNGVRADCLV